jgi:hypothetical protein
VLITLRLNEVDLSGFVAPERMFERLEFINCTLHGADFSRTMIRELAISGSDMSDAMLAEGSPEVLQLDFAGREFEPVRIRALLKGIGVAGLEAEAEDLSVLEATWKERMTELLTSRLRQFQAAQAGQVLLWDRNISERNLLGGLNQVDRLATTQALIPALLRQGVITRRREHNTVVYHLTDVGRQDGNPFLTSGTVQGSIEAALNEVAGGRSQ